ncbi:MAG: hypothetical protein KDF59_06195 [Nitrosomonas sp.]|nr:hypothetical protein [Nitrosomonas sp.]
MTNLEKTIMQKISMLRNDRVLGGVAMCYVQFCLFFGQKNQVFGPQDMLKHIQGAKTTIILFEKQTRRAWHIFVPACSRYLDIAKAMPCAFFTSIHQKSAYA